MLGFLLILLSTGCSREAKTPEKQASTQAAQVASSELVVVSTNDFHAALDRAEGLASIIREQRKRYGDHMIYLDAGDQFQGSLEGNIRKGEAVIDFFNLLHPDAAALGNHEFDYGPEVSGRVTVKQGDDGMGNLRERIQKANFPVLSANFILNPPVSCAPGPKCNALGQETVFEPRAVFQRAAGKVCVIGVTTPLTRNITNPAFLRGVVFADMKPVIQAEAQRFRGSEHCDWVLLLAHEGLRYESDGKTLKNTGLLPLLEDLPPSTVDAVIAGHSHAVVQTVIRGMPVVQTGKGAKNVGVLHLTRSGSSISSRFEPWIKVPDTAVAFDVTSLLMPYRREALDYKRRITGVTTAPFLFDKTSESALGNLVADAMHHVDHVKSDCAVINAGAIRSTLPHGRISNENVFRLMPFDDTLVVVDLTGTELRSLLEVSGSGALGVPSVSGLYVKYLRVPSRRPGPWDRDLNGDGKKEEWERNLVVDIRDAGGKPLDPNRTYRVATTSYLVEGGDFSSIVYDHIPPSRIHYYENLLVRDAIAAYLQRESPLNPAHFCSPGHSRITFQTP
ncbi:MAG TPA: bifunctional UDP-sugar hydrolase/5'-nucleotidase [Acidobacteriota bacterium]|nr:bifunctional UDP-sugar hydrolase/5'-nucleotidase [Acidobacteriota bacterium]